MVQSVVADINRRTGESECQSFKDRLLYAEVGQRDGLIDRSRTLSCHGELKNNRGLVSIFIFYPYISDTFLNLNPLFIKSLHPHPNILNVYLNVICGKENHVDLFSLSLCLSPEASCLSVPGRPGHHQVRLAERPPGQLPALPPANPHPAAGPGGPSGRRNESGRVHQRGLQQQRAQ